MTMWKLGKLLRDGKGEPCDKDTKDVGHKLGTHNNRADYGVTVEAHKPTSGLLRRFVRRASTQNELSSSPPWSLSPMEAPSLKLNPFGAVVRRRCMLCKVCLVCLWASAVNTSSTTYFRLPTQLHSSIRAGWLAGRGRCPVQRMTKYLCCISASKRSGVCAMGRTWIPVRKVYCHLLEMLPLPAFCTNLECR